MPKFNCPYCYGVHDLRACGLKCSYNVPGKKDVKCYTNVEKDARGFIPDKDKERCMRCTEAMKTMYCPVANKEIPLELLELRNSMSIALIGAKATGKSNYIGVLINEIKKKMVGPFNCIFSTNTSEESKFFYESHYYRPLYEKGEVVPATSQEIIPPMIFPLRFLDKKKRIKNTAMLTFYDTAGENFDDKDDILIKNRYLPNANGIILLLDPLQVPAIREKLKTRMTLPAQNTDAVDLLSRIVTIVRNVKNINSKKKINIPIALVFTKIDALYDHNDVMREDSILKEESQHLQRGVFVGREFQAVDKEIKDLLENWVGAELEQHLNNFSNYAFFGLSSLGGVPVGNKIPGGKIQSKRVLDPVLWLLAENKYITKVKE
ncbi:MAG: GTPase domain-containing protein [Clostridia bacterium]|nr:GTPase domain-containing protein [Clostridia bacterium]